MSEELAKQVLGQLRVRRTLGDRIMARVGRWGWERPRVAVSARIFRTYRLADPWDPNTRDDDGGIGSVNPRFAEDRRKPAPHALPKEEKPKSPVSAAKAAPARPADAKPPTPPRPPENKPPAAPEARPTPTPSPSSATTPRPGEPAPIKAKPPPSTPGDPFVDPRSGFSYIPKTYEKKEKDKAKERPLLAPSRPRVDTKTGPALVGRLPVRPGMGAAVPEAVKVQEAASVAAAAAKRSAAAAPINPELRRPPMPKLAPPAPNAGGKKAGRVSLGPAVVVTNEDLSMELEVEELPMSARAPAPPPRAPSAPAATDSEAPRVVSAPAETLPVASPSSAAPPERPAPRPSASFFDGEDDLPPPPKIKPQPRPPRPGKGDDLDDMFAASANEGRMKLGKPKAKT